jgi:hypothetical protein
LTREHKRVFLTLHKVIPIHDTIEGAYDGSPLFGQLEWVIASRASHIFIDPLAAFTIVHVPFIVHKQTKEWVYVYTSSIVHLHQTSTLQLRQIRKSDQKSGAHDAMDIPPPALHASARCRGSDLCEDHYRQTKPPNEPTNLARKRQTKH